MAIIQRFGGALNLNIHVHALVIDGVFATEGALLHFHPTRRLTRDDVGDVVAVVARRIARLLERLCRYALRPPIAEDRLRRDTDGNVRLTLRHQWADGTTYLKFEPVELLVTVELSQEEDHDAQSCVLNFHESLNVDDSSGTLTSGSHAVQPLDGNAEIALVSDCVPGVRLLNENQRNAGGVFLPLARRG